MPAKTVAMSIFQVSKLNSKFYTILFKIFRNRTTTKILEKIRKAALRNELPATKLNNCYLELYIFFYVFFSKISSIENRDHFIPKIMKKNVKTAPPSHRLR